MLVVVDEVRDGVKHVLFCQVVSLGKVGCLIDVIMLYNRIVVRAEKEEVSFERKQLAAKRQGSGV